MGYDRPVIVPLDVREIRPSGTLYDFKDGLAQAILNLVIAHEVAETFHGLYIYGASFLRLSMIGLWSPADNSTKEEIVVVVEDVTVGAAYKYQSVEDFLSEDFRAHMPWRLYDPKTKKLDPKGVAAFDAYNQSVVQVGLGHNLPEDKDEPVPTPFLPSGIVFNEDNAGLYHQSRAHQMDSANWASLKVRIAALQLLKTDILRVSPSVMDDVIGYHSRTELGDKVYLPSMRI